MSLSSLDWAIYGYPKRSERVSIQLPSGGTEISAFAINVAKHLALKGFFARAGMLVVYDPKTARICSITPEEFRTLPELFCRFYRIQSGGGGEVSCTMSIDTARAVIVSTQFLCCLPGLHRVNNCRQPVWREDGNIELLPEGYDPATKTLTISTCEVDEQMGLEGAKTTLTSLLREFQFVDEERSIGVVIAGMLGLYVIGLLPPRTLRPAFVLLANAEGAGKSLLAKIMIIPTFGTVPVGTRPEKEEEFEKVLLSLVKEGAQILFMDNLKRHLSSTKLEAFLTSETWKGRLLGVNDMFEADNLVNVFVTGNGLTVSPDLRRRSLFIELLMNTERAEDRVFEVRLDDEELRYQRPRIVSALYSLVRHWDQSGRRISSRSHTAFPLWADIVGGIVEAAGFACPLDTPELSVTLDQDGDDMRRLVERMGIEEDYSFRQLLVEIRNAGAFENILGASLADEGECSQPVPEKLKPAEASSLGKLLGRYNGRQVGDYRFTLSGKGHQRKYRITALQK